jgi:hypothetical protein
MLSRLVARYAGVSNIPDALLHMCTLLFASNCNYYWPWRSQNHRHPGITDGLYSWTALTHKHLRITDNPGSQTPLVHRHPWLTGTRTHIYLQLNDTPLTRHHPRARWHLELMTAWLYEAPPDSDTSLTLWQPWFVGTPHSVTPLTQ